MGKSRLSNAEALPRHFRFSGFAASSSQGSIAAAGIAEGGGASAPGDQEKFGSSVAQTRLRWMWQSVVERAVIGPGESEETFWR